MKRPLIRIILAASVAASMMLGGGCWGRKFFRAPGETIETSTKVDSLLKENMILQRRVYNLEKMLADQQDYSRGVNAQLRIDLEELKDQINALYQSVSEGNPFEPSRTERERRVDNPTRIQDVSPQDTLPVAGGETSGESGAAAPAGGPEAGAQTVPGPAELHRQVYLDFSRMDYNIALEESETFLQYYADDPLAEEVRFVRGECFMQLEQYLDALKEFSAILQQFPGGRLKPAALLRMAISYDEIGDKDLAAGVARRLVREHPGTEEAATARDRFGDLVDDR